MPLDFLPPKIVLTGLGALVVLGHASLDIFVSNRMHATGLSKRVLRVLSLVGHGSTLLVAALVAITLLRWWGEPGENASYAAAWESLSLPVALYAAFCCLVAVICLPLARASYWLAKPPRELLAESMRKQDLRHLPCTAAGFWGRCVRMRMNESLLLDITRKELGCRNLDARLDGLRIAHLSDLHFTGRIGREYFAEVVRETNALNCDLVAITGDLLDRNACLEWIPETLGKLRAPLGVYFVLGNHDLRIDHARLIVELERGGCVHLGGRYTRIKARDCPMILAGNELPWFGPAADLADAPLRESGQRAFRIALSHSPDQVHWARKLEVDLLLAGHLHGGQIDRKAHV